MSRMFTRRKETRERRAREKKRERDEIFVFLAFFFTFFLALVFTREVSLSLRKSFAFVVVGGETKILI